VPTTPFPDKLPEDVAGMWMALREHAPVMLFGGVVLGAVLTPISYAVSYITWGWLEHWRDKRKEPEPPLNSATGRPRSSLSRYARWSGVCPGVAIASSTNEPTRT